MQSIENKVITAIYGKGRGWVFSQNDFAKCGSRDAIDKSLSRIQKKGTIRRVIRGLYDYPPYSDLLKKQLSPDIDQVDDIKFFLKGFGHFSTFIQLFACKIEAFKEFAPFLIDTHWIFQVIPVQGFYIIWMCI